MNKDVRLEKDSMGSLEVPKNALYGAQTQRAVVNFPISSLKMPRAFIEALGLIKKAAAIVNADLKLLPKDHAKAIEEAAAEVAVGTWDQHFPVDIFQTGSATSSNMNANEVIALLASRNSSLPIHANDHVNMCQSSNDVIPTAIHLSASLQYHRHLKPALEQLMATIQKRALELKDLVKTGRTHLMDAMPLTFGQELNGWAEQIRLSIVRLDESAQRLHLLAIGGTAVGTGINAHPSFGEKMAKILSKVTGLNFQVHPNYFTALSSQDTAVEFSGQLRTLSVALMKIANDLRWMNSGPESGIGEISLPAVQPGSSIMPGKVNPVIAESLCMICAEVMGSDTTIAIAGQSGNFQLNVMLPLIAYKLLHSIEILSNGIQILSNKALAEFTVNREHIEQKLAKNPILVTALNPILGYEQGAAIAKKAYKEKRAVIDVAEEITGLSREKLKELLDPLALTKGGIMEGTAGN